MADTILYEKQKVKFAKALGKAQDAVGDLFMVAAELGITAIGQPESPAVTADGSPKKEKAKKQTAAEKKAEKKAEKASAKNGSAFAEM